MNMNVERGRQGVVASAVILTLFGGYLVVRAGSLDPSGSPAPTMVTLQQIYDKASAAAAQSSPCELYRFVGVSSASSNGGAGWKGLSNLCVSQFVSTYPSIRMCTSEEILRTPPNS